MIGVMLVQGQALRAEDIGHNLAETGHSHDGGAAEDLRAVPQLHHHGLPAHHGRAGRHRLRLNRGPVRTEP
jgi:hypothetical protein